MVTSVVKAPTMESNTTSSSSSNSLLGSGLSRKNSVKPTTGKATLGLSSASSVPTMMLAPSITSILPPSLASTTPAKKAINSCSNIVVQDDDIRKFLAILKKSNALFDTTTHQDAHELLNFILNRIGEDIFEEAKADGRTANPTQGDGISVVDVNSKGQSWVHRVFKGILTNETRCLTCETVTSRDECFLDLSIDIEKNSSVTACLRQFSASEMLYARNKFFCDTCSSLQEAEKRMKVKKLPNVLALHLKRFKYEEAIQKFVKLTYRVVFPFDLRLFNTSDDAHDPDRLYELFAIIVHIGMGPHHGHYITIVKVGLRWFVFDDETINIIDEADICRYYGDTPGAGSAYVLFYQAAKLNMQDLGLTDTEAEKQRAKEKAEAILWDHFMSQQKQHQSSKHHDTPNLKVDMSRLPSSLTSPIQASPTTSDIMTNEYRSAGMSPNVSSSGITASGLFSRKQNPTSPTALTSPNGSDVLSESKPSWFSSLRSGNTKKASANASVLSPPSSSINPGTSPPSAFKAPVASHSDRSDDLETASISTSSSSRRGHKESIRPIGNDHLHHTPAKGALNTTESNHFGPGDVPDALPTAHERAVSQGESPAGAAWTPAGRSLTKRDQEIIARQSRRSSISASISSVAGSALPPILSPASSKKDTSEAASESNGSLFSRKPSIRRPVTSENVPMIDGQASFASRRRTTLSRAFGLGKKTDKQ